MHVVLSSAEHRVTQALSVIAKMIQRITCYKKMLDQQRLAESVWDEVLEELARMAGDEAEAVGFARAEAAFLWVLRAKVDLLNVAQEKERTLQKELRAQKETHKENLISLEEHIKTDFQRLEKEKAELKARVVKDESSCLIQGRSADLHPVRCGEIH